MNSNFLSNFAKNINPVHWYFIIFVTVLFYGFLNYDILPLEYISESDEKSYIDIVQNFSSHLTNQDFNSYYNSRILIPVLSHYVILVFDLDYNIPSIRNVFLWFNLLSILLSCYYFYKIVKFKKYKESTIIIGFCFLFVNFFVLKFSNYYPVLMDIFGFTSGIILLYYYIVKNKIAFFLTLFLSMFIFPTTILIVLSIIASSLIVYNDKGVQIKKNLNKFRIFFFTGTVLILLLFIYKLLYPSYIPRGFITFELKLVPITGVLLLILIFYILKPLLLLFDKINFNKRFFSSGLFYLSLLTLLLFNLISKHLSIHFNGDVTLSPLKFLTNIFYQSVSFPLKFLISHFVYYGLFISIFIIFQRHFFKQLKKSSSFFKIITVVFIMLSMGTETRQFIQLFPFIVLTLLDSLDKYNFNKKFLLAIFSFQILWSRFWYSINIPEGFLVNINSKQDYQEFPAQRYFQFQGPWMSTDNSIIYGSILIFTYLILLLLFKLKNKNEMMVH